MGQTPKELFLELLKPDGHPDRQLVQYEALSFYIGDPISQYLHGNRKKGTVSVDRWGITISYPEDAPGPMPVTTDELKVCKDIAHWRDYVKVPDIVSNCNEGWEEAREEMIAKAGPDHLTTCFMGTGMFEELHYLMGFEDALSGFYEHPKEMHELIEVIKNYRITYVKKLIEHMRPEVVFTHDDWGAKESLFLNPDMWREFFKEPYREFYQTIRSYGCIAVHHADSYRSPSGDDMCEVGIQLSQGVLRENDIPELQARLKGKMVLMGGLGAAIDRKDSTEKEIRDYTRDALAQYCPGGHFIPCITYGFPGTVYKHVDPILNEEIERYNQELHISKQYVRPTVRRIQNATVNKTSARKDDTVLQDSDLLTSISQSLYKGQRKKLLDLCKTALSNGISAHDILSKGMIQGMSELGDDFSANRVFVPELLMAAKCMKDATELLKPYLTGANDKRTGKVCLATMRGDMHDIGKNLVKIMMEGSGIEVIDLGIDVEPEKVVQSAIDQNCDIIACSSLLTTSTDGIRQVIEQCRKRGIRDRVKIIIGGAPVNQSFCDEVGADGYSEDAAAAARLALDFLKEKNASA